MTTTAVLTADPRIAARYRRALGERHRIVEVPRWAALPGTLLNRPVHLVAVVPTRSDGLPAPEIGWLRRRHPSVATLLHLDPGRRALDAWRAGRAGADGLVVAGVDDDPENLRRRARVVLARALARRVEAALPPSTDPLLRRCLSRTIAAGGRGLTSEELAEAEGLDVGSLRRLLSGRGLLPPGRIARWGRLLHAAGALDRGDDTVELIALRHGYSTGAALGRAFRRDIGLPPSRLRDRGALACAIDSFPDGPQGRDGPEGPELVAD